MKLPISVNPRTTGREQCTYALLKYLVTDIYTQMVDIMTPASSTAAAVTAITCHVTTDVMSGS